MEVHVKVQAQNLKHNSCAFGGRAPKEESYLLKGFNFSDTQAHELVSEC